MCVCVVRGEGVGVGGCYNESRDHKGWTGELVLSEAVCECECGSLLDSVQYWPWLKSASRSTPVFRLGRHI